MFSSLMQLVVLFFLGVMVFTPTYINITKRNMYEEWNKIWKNEVEAEKRKLAMQEVSSSRKQKMKKTKEI